MLLHAQCIVFPLQANEDGPEHTDLIYGMLCTTHFDSDCDGCLHDLIASQKYTLQHVVMTSNVSVSYYLYFILIAEKVPHIASCFLLVSG